MLRMEFHCHTQYSKDSLTTVEELLTACRRKSIDRVVITDHNTIRGALVAKQLDPACVIVGEEIKTKAGELLAAFVQEEIPPNLEPLETIRRLKGQGAFISVSHPFDRMRAPWEPEALDEILPYIDAIETFNSRCMWPGFNYEAQSYARRNRLPGTSGSDAHTPSEIGTATMLLEEFEDAESLRVAMRSVTQRNRLSGPWVHFASLQAVREKRRTGHEV